MSIRWLVWVVVNLALLVTCIAYSEVTDTFDASGIPRVILGFFMGLLGLVSVFVFPKASSKQRVFLVLIVSLLPRLALIPTAPSDDVNRYLWEGKLSALGIDPYQAVADDPVFSEQRDIYWEAMNHRDRPTAYPPLAMQTFRVINSLGYHPMSYKVAALLLDMLLIATLLALIRHHSLPENWVLFYALSPLSLLSFAAEGHFDVVMVLAIAIAILAHSKRWWIVCGAAVATAVGVKLMAAVIAPLLLWHSGKRGWIAAAITLILPLVFYWQSLDSLGYALFAFGSGGRFNGAIHQLLSWFFANDYTLASIGVAALYAICWILAFRLMQKKRLWSSLLVALGSLIVLSPIVHFWYLTWVLPLIAVRPKLSWVSLSLTCSLYFLVWHHQENGLGWTMPLWAKWAFWLPFFLLLIAENRKFFSKMKSLNLLDGSDVTDFSIVIPTYNPGENLQKAVDSLASQSLLPREIILADARSDDGSLANLDRHDLTIDTVKTNLGRGRQIKAGVEHARGEWVIILHSDVVLTNDTLFRLAETLKQNPHTLGGALGQRFATQGAGLLLIEAMNEFRSVLMHTSFGDQTQFFHRESAIMNGVLTKQPLMEDVEMSDRLNALGDTLYVATEGKVSAKKWMSGGFWKRFFTVIEFCLRYRLLAYTRQQRSELSHRFYERYYRPSEQ